MRSALIHKNKHLVKWLGSTAAKFCIYALAVVEICKSRIWNDFHLVRSIFTPCYRVKTATTYTESQRKVVSLVNSLSAQIAKQTWVLCSKLFQSDMDRCLSYLKQLKARHQCGWHLICYNKLRKWFKTITGAVVYGIERSFRVHLSSTQLNYIVPSSIRSTTQSALQTEKDSKILND